MTKMDFFSDEVNLLIYRYLRESGFEVSAYSLAMESNVGKPNIDVLDIPCGALISMILKGFQYVGVEIEVDNEGSDVEDLVKELNLIEATKPDILEIIKKKKESQKTNFMTVHNNTDEGMVNDFNRNEIVMNSDPIEIPPSCVKRLGKLNNIFCAWNPINNLLAGDGKDGTARICNIDNVPNTNDVIFNSPFKIADEEELNDKEITCLDWSFDGNYLAVGYFDGEATVWTTGGCSTCKFQNDSSIFTLKWNQRGNYILTGGGDGTTKIWSALASNHCIQKFHFHSARVLDVAWETNTTFASCSADTFIYVCQLNKKEPLKKFQGHTREINNIEWDPQGKFLASCSDDTTLKIWSMKEDTCLQTFQGHSKDVCIVKWSPTGPGSRNPNRDLILASSSIDATIRLWDVKYNLCVSTLTQHNHEVVAINFSPDGKFLVSGSCDTFVYIWSLESREIVRSFKARGEILDVTWNSRGDQIAACSTDGDYVILDLRQLKL